jgi:hypothetical protein
MTLDEALKLAHRLAEGWAPDTFPYQLAQWLVDILDEAQPCGFEEPTVRNDGVGIPASWSAYVSPPEARLLAAMLLRAADEAEGGHGA